jgi:DNA-binding NarL/FixJ family response regulator
MMLLDRDRELAALDEHVAEAAAGVGRLVLIEGPAGIGKSGLLADLRGRVAAGAAPTPRVLAARASELEREFAFGVVRQLFEADAVARPYLALAGAAGPAAAVFAAPAADGAGVTSFAALHGLFWLAANLAAERPLLLAVDDLPWCDRPSLRFLAYLARRLEGLPILLAATMRAGEQCADPALLAEVAHDPAAVTLTPGPLSAAGAAALVRERLGAGADDAFCRACHEATGGNPLLLRQLVRALEAEGAVPDAGQVGVVRAVGPRAASSTVLVRLGRLPADAAAVARAVSVLGDSAELPAVAALAGLDEPDVAAATGELARVEILRPDPPLGFVHPLVRDAIYHELAPGERGLLHERAARLLHTAGAPPEQVAAQLLEAPHRGDPWAIDLLEEAGRTAMRRGAPDSAVAYLRRALEEPPPDERRTAVLLSLGAAEALTSGPAAVEHLQAGYDALEDPIARGQVADGLGRALLFTARVHDAAELARVAAVALPQGSDDLRRTLEALELATHYFGEGGAELRRRQARHRGRPGPGGGAKALAALAAIDWTYRGGSADECCGLALAALEDGELIESDNGLMSIPAILTLALADREEAVEILERSLEVAYRHGSLFSAPSVQLFLGMTRLWRGDLAGASASLAEAKEGFRAWGFGAVSQVYCDAHLAAVACASGDVAGARRILDRQRFLDEQGDATRHWLNSHMEILVAEARWEETLEVADAWVSRFGDYRNPVAGRWRARKAEALARLGRNDEAVALAASELEDARTYGAPGAVGGSLRVLGTLRGEDGLPLLEEAVAVLAGSPARLEQAGALAALGSALRRARRPTEAREPLRRALELAAACDAPGLAEHIRTELYATGARPRTDALAGVAALTASELRVVERAAAGQTNRDIAQALYVTPKTVEVHLSSAYRKLGIRSRRELPGVLTP